ncbi:MAG: GTP cyclohydrolase [Flavobacteriaceae bacterium]|nr:GTP cyclohydrolase [Flavobacteriaceae bacterium]
MIKIIEATSSKLMKDFVKFPFSIYKDSKAWVPPIIKQELETFNKKKNPIFKDADAKFFLAYKEGEIVGRIAGIVNWLEVKNQNQKKMRFGWFDFIDDKEVSTALLDKVKEMGAENNLDYMEGPVGFSNLDKVGVITEGFEETSNMITWYNHSYYVSHYEAYGLIPEKHYSESKFPFSNVNPDDFLKIQSLIKRRYGLRALSFQKTEEVMPYADAMFELFNKSYSSLSSFVEITPKQKEYFKEKFISFVNPDYIKFVVDKDDNLIAFAVVMPSFANALRKAKGKLFPIGFSYILNAKKNSKDVIFYLIGVLPEFQNKGVTAIIFDEYYKTFSEKGIQTCYRTPELEDNKAIHLIWKNFNPTVFRKRKTYKKEL